MDSGLDGLIHLFEGMTLDKAEKILEDFGAKIENGWITMPDKDVTRRVRKAAKFLMEDYDYAISVKKY